MSLGAGGCAAVLSLSKHMYVYMYGERRVCGDRETETDGDGLCNRVRDREGKIDGEAEKHLKRERDRQRQKEAERQSETNRVADRETDRQTVL